MKQQNGRVVGQSEPVVHTTSAQLAAPHAGACVVQQRSPLGQSAVPSHVAASPLHVPPTAMQRGPVIASLQHALPAAHVPALAHLMPSPSALPLLPPPVHVPATQVWPGGQPCASSHLNDVPW